MDHHTFTIPALHLRRYVTAPSSFGASRTIIRGSGGRGQPPASCGAPVPAGIPGGSVPRGAAGCRGCWLGGCLPRTGGRAVRRTGPSGRSSPARRRDPVPVAAGPRTGDRGPDPALSRRGGRRRRKAARHRKPNHPGPETVRNTAVRPLPATGTARKKGSWESRGYTPPAVIERDERVRAPHLGASTLRPRMTPGSAPRCSGVRMFPDMSLPVCCHDRSFQGQMDRSANHVNP